MSQQAPLSYSVTQPNSLTDPFTLANAFLTPAISATPQTYAIDPNFHIGYLHYWQASIQQNLSPSIILTLNYQGKQGHAPGAGVSPEHVSSRLARESLTLPATCT